MSDRLAKQGRDTTADASQENPTFAYDRSSQDRDEDVTGTKSYTALDHEHGIEVISDHFERCKECANKECMPETWQVYRVCLGQDYED